MFLLQAPGLPFSCPVCSRRNAVSLSFTTVSSLIIDRSTWEEDESKTCLSQDSYFNPNNTHNTTSTNQMSFTVDSTGADVAWASYQPSLLFLDSASEPFASLLPAPMWAACSFLSTAHTWDTMRMLHTADECLCPVKNKCNLNSAYQSLCRSSLLFVLSCLAVHGAPTNYDKPNKCEML